MRITAVRAVSIPLMVTLGFLFLGCNENNATGAGATGAGTPFQVAKSEAQRITEPASSSLLESQAVSINQFALDMYNQLVDSTSNLFFSPYSITAALGMTEAGARGETAAQIRKALSVPLSGDDFHEAINSLDLSLADHAEQTEGLTLNVANSIWAQTGWDMRVGYLDLLSRYYGAGVNLLDFKNQPDSSRTIINTWVADQTNQKIKNLIPAGTITTLTRLVLTNAIYFLGDWLYQFDPALTSNETFTLLDNQRVSVPLMQLGENGKEVRMNYARKGNVRAIDLPYRGNRLSMTVVLPDQGAFREFEQNMTAESIDTLIQALDSTDLPPVRLPKFTFTSASVSLKPALLSLGMTDAFTGAADLSGIDGTKSLYVQDVIHKAFIAVDEQGTEAAAATAVIIGRTSAPVDPPHFVADRPFVYLIRDTRTGAILFMGRVMNPTAEG